MSVPSSAGIASRKLHLEYLWWIQDVILSVHTLRMLCASLSFHPIGIIGINDLNIAPIRSGQLLIDFLRKSKIQVYDAITQSVMRVCKISYTRILLLLISTSTEWYSATKFEPISNGTRAVNFSLFHSETYSTSCSFSREHIDVVPPRTWLSWIYPALHLVVS